MCLACRQNNIYKKGVNSLALVNEVNLFKELIISFRTNSQNSFVKEFHQKSYVDFSPRGPFKSSKKYLNNGGNPVTCELSDIYLVVYCPHQKSLKHTFIQAKYDTKNDCNQILNGGSQAELHQWDLLHFRPQISNGNYKGKSFPANILSSATYPVVGSYVFFDTNRDFCFFSADILKPKSTRSKIKGIVHNYHQVSSIRQHSLDIEKVICNHSSDFFHSTYSFEIGSPVTSFQDLAYLKSLLSSLKDESDSKLIDEILKTSLSEIDGAFGQKSIHTPYKSFVLCRAF